uniref:carbonic anhydrase 2-like isoform X1 n=2 Tax=Styela clava TaxID=7725 RepID=UPI001939F1F8|nr:carbonic anhydrase 2-like isoform X1 [Styela clava]
MRSLVNRLASRCITQIHIRSTAKMSHAWGYASSQLPPEKWHEQYPIANGKNQSPIDLVCSAATVKDFPDFNLSYKPSDLKNVVNNGHSVTFFASGGASVLSGGPLSSQYTLEQFHFHWGEDSRRGSEHLLDGKSFAAEVHLVHWNSGKYESFVESLNHPDGLCVLGAFLQKSEAENANYKQLFSEIKEVPLQDDKRDVERKFDPRILLPENIKNYFHYSGSLTTPPLNECVQWVVFKTPVDLSEEQLQAFRDLHIGKEKDNPCLCDNYRPPQDVGTREVFSC